MDINQARTIVSAINSRCYATAGIDVELGDLSEVSLPQMLEAKGIVESANRAAEEKAKNTATSFSISMVPDDRLIAAVYCSLHYRPDDVPILCLPYSGWNGNRLIVAVTTGTATEDAEDEE